MLAVDDETLPVLLVRLSQPLNGRDRVDLEQTVHDRVELVNPALVGVFAFRYLEP